MTYRGRELYNSRRINGRSGKEGSVTSQWMSEADMVLTSADAVSPISFRLVGGQEDTLSVASAPSVAFGGQGFVHGGRHVPHVQSLSRAPAEHFEVLKHSLSTMFAPMVAIAALPILVLTNS
eukprot:CAMPEP_0195035438 /NCGR_PEP_ID=MMETSP0326_2-20130528/70184_1 /TAXON_ID=2866 ORGANISM="Crypthecodinium cohnii, Strain Seligo" /NCGR_SAMPLE_ID=MMETSP0326_2 /ASSEMBLY_ACC=CAM_ASM_000348 /LENGTH=121 /DNA_ID=CAMNT_0040060611 /DNA_START=190 /DNA_END=553 /DNA_ORIENTATION=+